jgi:hypothetical protein
MGVLKHLLFWPVTGPIFLMNFSFEKVAGVVQEELTDDSQIKSELMELQLLLELGDIDDDEYVRRESVLMFRLREIREWRERFGMGVSGGPVRVQGGGEEQPAPPEEERVPQVAQPGEVTIDFKLDFE